MNLNRNDYVLFCIVPTQVEMKNRQIWFGHTLCAQSPMRREHCSWKFKVREVLEELGYAGWTQKPEGAGLQLDETADGNK